jgi:AraC-like DNA-binding protein
MSHTGKIGQLVRSRHNGHMSPNLDELRRLRRARDRMDREYAQPLDVPALASQALMSPAHFIRRFREAYSETPYSYLMTRRVERAKALLRRGDLSVTDVCFEVGWTSLGSFSARFTELVGETPSEYRARRHEDLQIISPCQIMVITRPRKTLTRAPKESNFEEATGPEPAYHPPHDHLTQHSAHPRGRPRRRSGVLP